MLPKHVTDHNLSGNGLELTVFGATHEELLGLCLGQMSCKMVRFLESLVTSSTFKPVTLGPTGSMHILAMALQLRLIVEDLFTTAASHPHDHDLFEPLPKLQQFYGVSVILLGCHDVLQKLLLTLKIDLADHTVIEHLLRDDLLVLQQRVMTIKRIATNVTLEVTFTRSSPPMFLAAMSHQRIDILEQLEATATSFTP